MRRTLIGAVALCLLAFAPVAQATYDPLGSGQTRLALDSSFLTLLRQNGVKLSAVAPARLSGGTVSFPVSGGKFDPVAGVGTVEHEGALVFRAGNRRVPIRALQLKTTQRRSPLSAKVGGSQLKLAGAGGLEVSRAGFADEVRASALTLSAKLATRLAKKLRLRGAFEEGQPLGRATTKANPAVVTVLARGKVTLTLDPGFQARLASLFVALNPIFGAEHPGPFTLPIAGGEIAPDASQGRVETSGSLEFLQQGGGQVFWADSALDLAAATFSPEAEVRPSPPFGGKLGQLSVAALNVTSSSANAKARSVSVAGSLSLDASAAQLFEEAFAKPQGRSGVFAPGEAVGSVAFTAQGQ